MLIRAGDVGAVVVEAAYSVSVEISEGETSGEDYRDGDHSDIDD